MWAAFVRQIAAFAITRRGKKMFALMGVLLLCFGAALLVDLKLYFSAAFTTVLALFSAVAYVVQHVKIKRIERERLARKAEAARIRALTAQARLDRIDNAKGAVRGAVHDVARATGDAVTGTLSDAIGVAKGTLRGTTGAVTGAGRNAVGAADALARASFTRLAQRWQTLRRRQQRAG